MTGDHTATPRRRHRGLWVLAILVPFGLGVWAGFAYAAARSGIRRWWTFATLYFVAAMGGFVLVGVSHVDSAVADAGTGLMLTAWILGGGHALIARPRYVARMEAGVAQLEAARERLRLREDALRIAAQNPALARELGVGRPDRPEAMHAGLVDVNSAPPAAISRLPGIDDGLAQRIVLVREEIDGFSSLEDLGMTLHLPGDLVEDLRGHVVFLPR